jgi:hypothetical protein
MTATESKPIYTHGQRVRYIGPTSREDGVKHGETYTVFGNYSGPYTETYIDHGPKMDRCVVKKIVRDEVAVYVDDPDDQFGGVVGFPPDRFESIEPS